MNDFSSNCTKKLSKMVIKAIYPSASGLKKKGGALIRGGALNTENTVVVMCMLRIIVLY